MNGFDYMAVVYSIIGSLIVIALMQWLGVFRWAKRKLKHRRGINLYKKNLTSECEFLTVVGRRQGFSMKEVFVELDIALSDLMPRRLEKTNRASGSYVLVGGPGAGKSTIAKSEILGRIRSNIFPLPFFVRLREYVEFESIEDFIIHKLTMAGIQDPKIFLQSQMSTGNSLCVLDGLDEVRPQNRKKTYADINHFYSSYFLQNRNRLVVTCRKEAYRHMPLNINEIWEVRPLNDQQIVRFAEKWPLGYPKNKSADTFCRDLAFVPRILELARSPLLLVGALMQYTESNLGIPDERFQYLARVAKWLVSDWAIAQGGTPDQYLHVYDRLLARIAFHMHSNQMSDLDRGESLNLIKEWLPEFGFQQSEANNILTDIITKTGIMASEAQSTLVFAQFGLQEYFASLELTQKVKFNDIANLSPEDWWREVILLATAQQRDPIPLLEAMFAEKPILAATAVAECPTPPLSMQKKAIKYCIEAVDKGNMAANSAIVPLLRKVKEKQEEELCSLLEERLDPLSEHSSLVGIALATAGTALATKTLAKYPSIWDKCLQEASYLSVSFENLLVDWIRNGNENQSQHATELISTRLSSDRLEQLLSILPELEGSRADYLASHLLKYLEEPPYEHQMFFGYQDEFHVLKVVSRCVPYIKNRERYLRERYEEKGHQYFRRGESNIIGTSMFIEEKGIRCSTDLLYNHLINAFTWTTKRGALLCWLCSVPVIMVIDSSFLARMLLLIPFTIIFIISVSFPTSSSPWDWTPFMRYMPMRMIYPTIWRNQPITLITTILVVLSGFFLALSFLEEMGISMSNLQSYVSSIGLATVMILVGFILWSYSHFGAFFSLEPVWHFIKGNVRIRLWIPLSFFLVMLALFIVAWTIEFPIQITIALKGIMGFFMLWLVFTMLFLQITYRKVCSASERAHKFISDLT